MGPSWNVLGIININYQPKYPVFCITPVISVSRVISMGFYSLQVQFKNYLIYLQHTGYCSDGLINITVNLLEIARGCSALNICMNYD
jgi:hypothetical protein